MTPPVFQWGFYVGAPPPADETLGLPMLALFALLGVVVLFACRGPRG